MSSPDAAVDIVPLQPHDTKAFIKLPWTVYANDPQWVPPLILERRMFLNPRKNPFFQHAQVQLFLARRHAHVVGRIAAVINAAHDQHHHERAGFFGFFECQADAEAAAVALFRAAEEWVRERGATFLRGPVNLSTNELDCGLLVDGFDLSPVFHSSYNPPYYETFIKTCGFTTCKELLAFLRYYDPPPPPRLQQVMSRLQERRKVTIRTVNMRNFQAEVTHITAIYNDAWRDNWGFVPISDAESQHMARSLRLAVLPQLTLLAEIEGEPVGCFVAIPDLNQALRHLHGRLTPWGLVRFFYARRRIDVVRVAMMGVKKRYRRLGIDLLMLAEAWKQASMLHINRGELAWVLEDNEPMVRALQEVGAQPYKRYRLYQKAI
ncbi:MAG: N-acetyltransferase [bacterium]|nr:N-acetyltransferase [bacterium]